MPVLLCCPICQKAVPLDSPEMPFCSKRCRLLDLGNWASEKYVISTPAYTCDPIDIDDHPIHEQ